MPPRAKPAPKKQASAFYNYEDATAEVLNARVHEVEQRVKTNQFMQLYSAIDAHLPTPVIRQLFPHSILPFPSFAPRGSPYRCRYLGNASGVVMPIEAISIPGKGGLWVKTHAYDLGITESPDNQFLTNRDIHVHMPEGSIGKEGHSMGTAILSAFVSLFTKTKIDQDIAPSAPSTPGSIAKQSVPLHYPQVLALPITCHRLFPGFYKAVAIRNSSVITALKEMMKQGQPYLGAFFLKDPNADADTITDLDQVHPVGVFAQITSMFSAKNADGEGLTTVLYPNPKDLHYGTR
ncbi:hypothetical protein BDQ17DRAFT_1425180 [Cyathus striatus]|nr:hypothetical protein BDQ17DRAFT_1425180 [Cyathus striatus]